MSKKITVTLDDIAAQYFAEVKYSLDYGKGVCTNSEVISHCLGELAAFEKITDDQLTNWLDTNHPEILKKYLKDNGIWKEKAIAQPAQ